MHTVFRQHKVLVPSLFLLKKFKCLQNQALKQPVFKMWSLQGGGVCVCICMYIELIKYPIYWELFPSGVTPRLLFDFHSSVMVGEDSQMSGL